MKVYKDQSGNIALIAVAVVVGLGIGFAVGRVSHSDSMTDAMKSSSSSSAPAVTSATDGVTVGGAKMVETQDIVQNAVRAKNVTTLVAAVKAAGLVDTLESPGPYTVFAPDNDAFAALPAGTVNTLLEPANKATLVKILTYHVVSGTYTTAALRVMAQKGQTLTSVEGEQLTPVLADGQLEIQDAKGNKVMIQTPDVISSNGVTHVIESVLMP
jgi:uncharacterized surface protein with fasciclin (FAS1) repeats